MNVKALIFMLSVSCVSGYKVLIVNPMPIKSLNSLGVGYVKYLLDAGHEVTYVSPFPMKATHSNQTLRSVDLSSTNMNALAADPSLDINYLITKPVDEYGHIKQLQSTSADAAEATFSNTELLAMLNDPRITFDVVIADYIESESYAALAAYYNCPMIWAYSLGSHWTTLRLLNEPTNPSYATDYLTPDLPPFNSVFQRLSKLWVQIQYNYYKRFYTVPREKALYEKVFTPLFQKRNQPLPDYNTLIYNASFVLSNDFVGNGAITNLPQNFKFIGGYHVDHPMKPLPEELKTVLDNAEHGFIYFSLGSLWQGTDIPENIRQGLLDVFGSLRETVIWKYEDELPNKPKNVHTIKWAPQQSILGHPKCLFFISHGGLLSTIESVHYGVPTIGIPLYFDQFINVNRAVQFGRTIKVDLTLNLIQDLKVAMQKMFQDPTYTQKAKELSQIYHERTASPGKELVHWVEAVARTRGALHLRSPESQMPWWEIFYIDAVIYGLHLVLLSVFLCRYLLRAKAVTSHKKEE